MANVIFIHGMFQTPKSWARWIEYFAARDHRCFALAWPLHEGEPAKLRADPPSKLGELRLNDVIARFEDEVCRREEPIMIGHSVGGLVTQILLNKGLGAAGVAISPVAPNGMVDLDWGFIRNNAAIINPLKGDAPVLMDAKAFHSAFANTLSEEEAAYAYDATATHDSRNVLRDCMGSDGRIDVDAPHQPLLLIGGDKDEIVPVHLTERNYRAYSDQSSVTEFRSFAGRSHYICNEPGWEEVADSALSFIDRSVRSAA